MTDLQITKLVVALRKATVELNAIKARDGAPLVLDWGPAGSHDITRVRIAVAIGPMVSFQVSEEYFRELVDECKAILKEVDGLS